MLDSVRVRLTVWYAALLAVFLVVLALATYLIFWRSTLQRTDSNLSELSEAFLTTLYSELPDHRGPEAPRAAAEAAITEHRFREHAFVILDPAGRLVISSNELPSKSPEESFPAELLSSPAFRKVVEAAQFSERAFGNVPGKEPGYRATVRRFSAADQTRSLRLNVAEIALDAASEGAGVVLGYKLVAAHDITLGRLVSPFGPELPLAGRAYHFVCARGQERRPMIKAFRDWLFAEIADTFAKLPSGPVGCVDAAETHGKPQAAPSAVGASARKSKRA